ncbi:MAG: hypothetical protein BA872_08335 [Desulfobacterales bacterium C00003060]|nr:MAG: hypothetical protein BA861_12120 [Desulfobacterales bacterium S3730MH5]OEU78205.1 MAG: hypothetical protein BA872_08335 [Desulfobacterales bacterium C00003060]OEU80628.1 MAG: hypothetical protein BA865_00365 [Desulfobacterales bacterium S5133MH4]
MAPFRRYSFFVTVHKESPVANLLEKQGLETPEWKEACHPMNDYPFFLGVREDTKLGHEAG